RPRRRDNSNAGVRLTGETSAGNGRSIGLPDSGEMPYNNGTRRAGSELPDSRKPGDFMSAAADNSNRKKPSPTVIVITSGIFLLSIGLCIGSWAAAQLAGTGGSPRKTETLDTGDSSPDSTSPRIAPTQPDAPAANLDPKSEELVRKTANGF